SAGERLAWILLLPGSHYSVPEFSWKLEVAPAGIGFMNGRGIGPQYDGDLFVGAARPFLEGGFLWHFNLTGNRRKIAVDDPRLEDRVADNLDKPAPNDPAANARALVESESLLFGRNFGIATDIQTGPNGNLFVVSNTDGAVYEIFRVPRGRRAADSAAPAPPAAVPLRATVSDSDASVLAPASATTSSSPVVALSGMADVVAALGAGTSSDQPSSADTSVRTTTRSSDV